MNKHFIVEKTADANGVVELRLAFGVAAQNPAILRDAVAAINELQLSGGKLVKLNGPCTIPVAMALAHAVAHKFGAVACYDPKLSPGYVVCISHDPDYTLGQQLE